MMAWLKNDKNAQRHLGGTYQDPNGHLWKVSSLTTGRSGDKAHLRSLEKAGRARNVLVRRLEAEYRQAAVA